jgi:TonB family protein
MTFLLDSTIRASALVLIALGSLPFLRRRSAALRHGVLAAAILCAAAMPVLTLVVPAWNPAPVRHSPSALIVLADTAVADVRVAERTEGTTFQNRPEQLVTAIWLLGVSAGLLALLTGFVRLARVAAASRPASSSHWTTLAERISREYGMRRSVRVLESRNSSILATWGVLRPVLILPAGADGWPAERAAVVLRHELAHVRRFDWILQMVAQGLRVVYWFNPLFWIACHRLRLESEYACDDAALTSGIAGPDYASHLLDLAHILNRPQRAWSAALSMARVSTTERRFAAMLNPALSRTALTRRTVVLTAAALLAIALPIAALRGGAQGAPLPLSGSIYDTTGAVLPGVEVALEGAAQTKSKATTDKSGQFQFPSVAPGRYVLTAELPGFRSLRHEFELSQPRDWTRAITLQVGQLTETVKVVERRVTGTKVPSAGAAAAPLRVGGIIRPPRKLNHISPTYPAAMREAGLEGVVPIEALIGRDGSVVSVRVLSANVHPEFAKAASEAVKQWRFDATLLNGEPVEVFMNVSVQFSLAD